jgi:hypothetical protein
MPSNFRSFPSAQMAESSYGAVVTEEMLIRASGAGDMDSLTIWAEAGVRVTTAEPLIVAHRGRNLKVLRLLVQKLGANVDQTRHGVTFLVSAAYFSNPTVVQCLVEIGADVNQGDPRDGRTALIAATSAGKFNSVRCLVEAGARIGAVCNFGYTALLMSARGGRYLIMRYLLEEAGADINDVNNDGESIWDLLIERLSSQRLNGLARASAALPSLLRVMVLRSAPPPALMALLSLENVLILQKGARLRARLPAYLAHRRAYLDSRCPRISLLPGVLRALIYTFEGPATTEELWATGLGQAN